MKNYRIPPDAPLQETTSSINNIDNVKVLVQRQMTLEQWGFNQRNYSVFKNARNYADARSYVRAIGDMVNRVSNIPSGTVPTAKISAVSRVTPAQTFTAAQMQDVDGDYQAYIRDMAFYHRVLSTAAMMEYITMIFEGDGNDKFKNLRATITGQQVRDIIAQVAFVNFSDVQSDTNNVSGNILTESKVKEET